jgi:iron complex outermembrane receptor protein
MHSTIGTAARSSLQVLLLSTVAFSATAALGQTATTTAADVGSAATATVVQDVIVTATRQSTKLQQTPVAVAVIGPEQIAQQNIITTRDLAGQIPGLFVQRGGITPTTEIFFIRGIGDADPIFDPAVAQYVDDVYLPRAINGMTDLTDIERVEVLRGPQGTLFGENADAGAIRYITKAPNDTPQLNFDIGGGTYDAVNVHAYAAGPILPGLLDGSIAIAHDEHDGYTYDPTIRQRVNNQDTTGARLKLLATPTSNLTALLTVDGTIDVSESAYYVPERPIIGGNLQHPIYGQFNPNLSYASQAPQNNSPSGGVSLKLSYDINPNLTFNSITAYRGFAQAPVNYNNDGQPLVAYSAANPTLVSISDNFIYYHEHETTQEFQFQGKYNRFDFTSGFYFLYENFASNRIGYVVSPTAASAAPAFPEDQIGDTRTSNYAVYTQGDYHLTDDLIITLGGRYTLEHRDFAFQGVYDDFSGNPITPVHGAPTSTPGGFAAANNFTYAGGKDWSAFTPKVGLSYQFTPDVFTYLSISTGFDAGGFNNRASSLATALPYNQENVTLYEAGLKSDWFDHRLRANATLFYNDYQNLQETAAVISPVTNAFVSVRSNANRAHTEGVEFETAVQPLEGLSLTGNASYLDTRFDSFPNAGTTVVGGKTVVVGASGHELPLSPHWQVSGAANYRIPLQIPGNLRIGGDVTYESAYFSDVFNYLQGKVPPQSFVDAFISYAPTSHLTFTLTGGNLANRLAYQSITWGGTANLWYGPMSPPRTVFFKVAYAL